MTRLKRIFQQLRVQMPIFIMMLVFAACFLLALLTGYLTSNALMICPRFMVQEQC